FVYKKTTHVPAKRIAVVADNALYYHCELVQKYLETSRIEIVFLPPYSPNLNLIERVWRSFKKKVVNNRYYETYDSFLQSCSNFFQRWKRFDAELRTLLTENFQIINAT
ncbi:MAG: transposase, partial [Planctomycetia bacterium]|nr:transposase [Planctomycetia bacterium]